ncbi:MAG TPA: NAD(P)-dependent oxidoreductase [Chromatiales bacterium]|nr:NAD(P)-dependent oxidoreductase [Chromatiales bacterium]
MIDKILVTGATGYVGRNFVFYLLEKGYEVYITVRDSSNTDLFEYVKDKIHLVYIGPKVTADSLSEDICRIKPDVVVHLASLYITEHNSSDIESIVDANILFGTQLLEAMDRCGCNKLVNVGTSWQHYNNADYEPVNLYAATKQAFLDVIKFYNKSKGIQVIDLKFFDTYGPDDNRKKIIPFLIDSVDNMQELLLSPGDQKINIVHIDDVMACLELSILRLKNEVLSDVEEYAVGADEVVTLKELIGLLEALLSRKFNIRWGGRPYRDREVMVPWNKGLRLPGWSPNVSLEEGLSKVLMKASGKINT